MDASLAEELNAVKQKLERLKLERDKTEKMLQERHRILEVQMTELHHRGEFQKELEIERMSPIRSLREKEMEKKNKDTQLELTVSETEESGESKEELVDENSTTESPTLSVSSSSPSKSSASITSKKLLPIQLRLSLESALDDK